MESTRDPRIRLCDHDLRRKRSLPVPMPCLWYYWKSKYEPLLNVWTGHRNARTHNVKILFQFGANVLYSVCVWRRELISSNTQNGSDLPPKSAAAKPVAPNTFTVKCPTSRRFCNVLSKRYRFSRLDSSRGSGLYDVKSVIVSDAVVPLIVSMKHISVCVSSNCCHILCVVSRGNVFKSIVHLPYWMLRFHKTISSVCSSSNKCKSNCSSHRACHDDLLLYFSFPSLQNRERKRLVNRFEQCGASTDEPT